MRVLEEDIKQDKFSSLQEKSAINLLFTYNWFSYKLKPIFNKFDLTQQQYNVLRILKGKYPEKISPNYIKDVMLDKAPDLTRLIDRLYYKNLVGRQTNPINRRCVDVWITQSGIQVVEKMTLDLNALIKECFGNVTTEELETFNKVLNIIRA